MECFINNKILVQNKMIYETIFIKTVPVVLLNTKEKIDWFRTEYEKS